MNSSGIHSHNRVIRVFISSTFRDMMRERDLLVKEVFPELRHKCTKRFVTFTEVDLRWGITEAQANESQVLPLCLAEIERSRPYFIGLLGERYGWIPDNIRPEVIEREPWLKEHVQGRTSVTELEILHGVLNNPEMQSHAFFYFRDPVYVNDQGLTDNESRDMVEHDIPADVEKYGEVEASRRTQERKSKLAELKQHIRDSKLPLIESYSNPDALAKIVLYQFDKLIDELYPEDQTPDKLVQERMAHEAHAMMKVFSCIDRPIHLASLNTFATETNHEGKGLVITGVSGGGKTSLLAAWARDWIKNYPNDFLFQHYFGSTPESTSVDGFLIRLLSELKIYFDIDDEIPTDRGKLREALPLWLAQTKGKGRLILVLDSLNQVQGNEPDKNIAFLPHYFPDHVIVLASSLTGPALDGLRERGWTEHELPLATEAEVTDMVNAYLSIHARVLEPEIKQQLIRAPGAKNPLYLRTVLEELRQFGSFEKLPARIRYYLEAENPKDLFSHVIKRWQEDFDMKFVKKENSFYSLVHDALIYLWAARQGLSESEWLDLLGDGSMPMPRVYWTPLFLAMEPHLSQSAGLFTFGHDYLRQAIEAKFVPSPELQKAAHLSLANYFANHSSQQKITPRKTQELPWQYIEAGDWEPLQRLLTDFNIFPALMRTGELAVLGYWLRMPLTYRLIDSYEIAWEKWKNDHQEDEEFASLAQTVGFFMETAGEFEFSVPFFRQALRTRNQLQGEKHPDSLASAHKLAQMLASSSAFEESEKLYKRVLEQREDVLGYNHPDTLMTINNLGHLHVQCGDLASAEPLYRRALEARERTLGRQHPDTLLSMHNLASLLHRQGKRSEAEALYRTVIELRIAIIGIHHPSTLRTMNNLGTLFDDQGNYTGAVELLRQVYESKLQVLGRNHNTTDVSAVNLANALFRKKDYSEAAVWYRKVVERFEETLGKKDPVTQKFINCLMQSEILAAGVRDPNRISIFRHIINFFSGSGKKKK